MSFSEFLLLFLSATGLSGLIGLEREMRIQRKDEEETVIGGMRTHAMLGSLGFLVSFVAENFSGWFLPLLGFGIFGIMAISHTLFALETRRYGMTSMFSLFASFIIGVFVSYNFLVMALTVSVFFTGILAFPERFHGLAERINKKELLSILQFLIFSFIILQILPASWIDPFGFFDWAPRKVWLMVMFVAAIRFIGYFLSKFIGQSKGTLLSGIIGGLVSSTAVTTGIAQESKGKKESDIFLVPIFVASGMMFFRVILEIVIVSPHRIQFLPLFGALAIMGVSAFVVGIFFFIRQKEGDTVLKNEEDVEISQPLHMKSALYFGGFFLLILVASEKIALLFSDAGLLAVGAIAGLTDVDAITLAMANHPGGTTLPLVVIFIAITVNTLVKVGIVSIFGSRSLLKRVAIFTTLILFCGSGGLWILM
ncbi:MAG: DUF4010 domain-containing protein [Candidatus Peregrinibacteria bacterium]